MSEREVRRVSEILKRGSKSEPARDLGADFTRPLVPRYPVKWPSRNKPRASYNLYLLPTSSSF